MEAQRGVPEAELCVQWERCSLLERLRRYILHYQRCTGTVGKGKEKPRQLIPAWAGVRRGGASWIN